METRLSTHLLTPSRRRTLALALLLALVVGAADADAAMRRAGRRAFLQVGDLYQRLNLSYNLSNQVSDSDAGDLSTTSHNFDERYTLGFAWILYNPRILKGDLTLTASLYQGTTSSDNVYNRQDSSGDSSGSALLYRLEGVLLEPTPYPVRFSVYADQNEVRDSFAPTYTIKNEGQSVTFTLKNRYLPASASYAHGTSKASGSGYDTTSEGDTYTFGASHSLSWSDTTFSALLEQQEIDGDDVNVDRSINRTSFYVHNVLHRENRQARRRELTTDYVYQQEKGTDPYQRQQLREHLNVELGRGFRFNGNYFTSSDRKDGDSYSTREGANASVTHTLYQNLRTTLSGSWSKGTNVGGETTTTGALSLAYSKILPEDGNLSLSYALGYSVNDQTYDNSTVAVNFEEHTVPAAADLPDPTTWTFSLGLNVVTSGIVVQDATRSWTYSEGSDYTVERLGNETFIRISGLPRGGLFPITYGTTILVSYRQMVNADLSYTTITQGAAGTWSRQGGKYVFGFDITKSHGEQTSGNDALGQTNDTFTLGLRAALNQGNTRYYALYRYVDAAGSQTNVLTGIWSHQRTTNYGSLSFNATDTFAYSSSSVGNDSRWSNSASAAASFSRTLYRRVGMKLDGRYENLLDEEGMRHRLNVGADLRTRYGRAWISLGLYSTFSWYYDSYTRTTNLFLNYSRTF